MTWVNPFDAVSLGGDAAPFVVTEPVTIGATTTAPTKPTAPAAADYISVSDDSSGWCDLIMNLSYETSLAGASPGSGIYLFALPGGYKFDLAFHKPSTETNQLLPGVITVTRTIPGSRGCAARAAAAFAQLAARVYDVNRFTMYVSLNQENSGMWNQISSAFYGLTNATTANSLNMAFRFKKG